jgi:hypothetical protein
MRIFFNECSNHIGLKDLILSDEREMGQANIRIPKGKVTAGSLHLLARRFHQSDVVLHSYACLPEL